LAVPKDLGRAASPAPAVEPVKAEPAEGEPVGTAVENAFRQEWGRIVAALIRLAGDWDLAEECAQDAFAQAMARWPHDGVPVRPGGWLMTVARNRALDRLRRSTRQGAKLRDLAAMGTTGTGGTAHDQAADHVAGESGVPDERLRLIFTCCHPALAMEARVALTLRSLAGLGTADIARAFLVPEATMAKRLVRAKHKIRHAGIPYRVPPANALAKRTSGVLAVLYLMFNEGYSASSGAELVRRNLCDEAIRLARLVVELLPDEPEAGGLLALMLFQRSRQAARLDGSGNLVTLEDQDRSLWDRADIEEAGTALAAGDSLRPGGMGPYRLQAAIAGCHVRSPRAAETDWPYIVKLYEQLAGLTASAVVELNLAVAVAMAEGPSAGLARVEGLRASGKLQGYYLLPATEADLLRRLGRWDEAAIAYRAALELAGTDPERRFLLARLAQATGLAVPASRPGEPGEPSRAN
jgi:RNA polymerase sigma-70 factor (ECF subfamily)